MGSLRNFSYWQSPLLKCLLKSYWNCFLLRESKLGSCFIDACQLEKFKISTTLLSIHNIIILCFCTINLFRQVFNVSVCSAQPKIFAIACAFDIMQLDNMLQIFFNCSYHGGTSLQTIIIDPSNHRWFNCWKSTIKAQEQGVTYVQS